MSADRPPAELDQWIRRGSAGEEPACAALFDHYYPQVFRLSLGLLNDWHDAEEVAQDTFVYALKNLARYDATRSAFRTWLFTIALSRCRNKRRRKFFELLPLESLAADSVPVPREVESALDRRGVKRQMWQALQALSPQLREAVVLRYLGEMRFKEVGEALGCNPKTAESRARLGVAAIRKHLRGSSLGWETALSEMAAW
jgi:RNA polymerase sigma-70 factor (ECF subfamily)